MAEQEVKTGELVLAELVHSGEEELVSAGIPDARYDARALLLHACGKTLAEYAAAVNESADEETVRLYRQAVKRRAAGEPLQYITQSAPFFGKQVYRRQRKRFPVFLELHPRTGSVYRRRLYPDHPHFGRPGTA